MKELPADKNNKITSNETLDISLPETAPYTSVNPMQVILFLLSLVWVTGVLSLFLYGILTYIRTAKRLKEAILYKDDFLVAKAKVMLKMNRKIQIFTSDRITTPVVYGLINPHIIIPLSLAENSDEKVLQLIYSHELIHIKRFDYIIKPLSFLALCIHWFNPIIWLGFFLSQKDMEMSCDEMVMKRYKEDVRSEYANLLIGLTAKNQHLLEGGLLAFGESNIKSRIKEIGNYKKPRFWIAITSLIILATIGILLLTNGNSQEISNVDEPITSSDKTITNSNENLANGNSPTVKDPIILENNTADKKPIDNQLLIDKLDKVSDETIKDYYELSPHNITVANTYEGNFTDSGNQELLVIFKLLNMPHAGGLDCSVVATYDKSTCNIISQKTFSADKCNFDILTDDNNRSYLLFVGNTTYQGYSSYSLGLWKIEKEWEMLYPDSSTNDKEEKKYELIEDGVVAVSRPIKKSRIGDTIQQEVKWQHAYNLVWSSMAGTLHFVDPYYGFAKIPFEKGYYDFEGSVNNRFYKMSFYPLGKEIVGSGYYWDEKKEVTLKGKIKGDEIILYEYDENGKNTGVFIATGGVDGIGGTWISADQKIKSQFKLVCYGNHPGIEYGKRYAVAVTCSDQEVIDFANKIQDYIINDNKEQLAELICYPISTLFSDETIVQIKSKDEFIKNYDQIFFPTFKDMLSKVYPKNLFANQNGVLYGDAGESWMNHCGFWIIEVPSPDGSSKFMLK
ncbi:MAG: M56 family metallopeptidase [Clostridia bacterium]|nr:M56 family metallopeptidase [Clostridia bacterium]